MADIAGVLATGGTALVSAAVGAGLTYWLGALNRRHQEAREDKTRWYEARFNAYSELSKAVYDGQLLGWSDLRGKSYLWSHEDRKEYVGRLTRAIGTISLVGSPETSNAAGDLFEAIVSVVAAEEQDPDRLRNAIREFREVARKDLGY